MHHPATNCRSNLTAAKLRQLLLTAVLAVCPLVACQTVNAQATATATLTSGGMNSITVASNGSFSLTLAVTTNFASSGYTVFYRSINGQGLFRLTALTYLDPIFMPGPGPIIDPFPGMTGLLNPSNMFDLGASTGDGSGHPAGTFNLQSVNISVLNAPIGTYTIFLDNRSIMTQAVTFLDVNMGGPSGPMFTVNVIPEPTTVGLLVMGGAMLLVAAWRQRRAVA